MYIYCLYKNLHLHTYVITQVYDMTAVLQLYIIYIYIYAKTASCEQASNHIKITVYLIYSSIQ